MILAYNSVIAFYSPLKPSDNPVAQNPTNKPPRPGACGTTNYGVVPETVSPFIPPACVGGTGTDNLGGLCGYACPYGYCPIHSCTCTTQGVLNPPLPVIDGAGTAGPGLDDELYDGLCNFACSRGYCPGGACEYVTASNGLFKNVTGVVNGGFRNATMVSNGTVASGRR